jgi:hypothetical protein
MQMLYICVCVRVCVCVYIYMVLSLYLGILRYAAAGKQALWPAYYPGTKQRYDAYAAAYTGRGRMPSLPL